MFEKFLFSKVEVWILLVVLILGILGVLFFGGIVQYKASGGQRGGAFGDFLLAGTKFLEPTIKLLLGESVVHPQRLTFSEFSGLKQYQQDFQETGTLLVSSYSQGNAVSTAFLYDLRRQEKLHEWVPPVNAIHARTSYHLDANLKENYRTQHPLLLKGGDIVFTSGEGPLVRMNACGELVWTIDRHFHHSIERSPDGHLFIPIVITPPQDPKSGKSKGHLVNPLRDDGFAEVSMEGEILREWSMKDILERHGYFGLLYGVGPYEVDRMHINDVQPIWQSDEYVQSGDLVISIRHLSTVLLFRPATDEIVWLMTGPWLNQHDVDYQGGGIFTIFGNDSIRGAVSRNRIRGYSTIWQYNQKTGQASAYLPLKHVHIFANSEGVHRVLDNGDVFIENTNSGMIHRVSADGLRWAYNNKIGDGQIGALHWSRYLTVDEATFPWLQNLNCDSQH